ncbi:hypothetical protein D3C85_1755410 [compost metagenome]
MDERLLVHAAAHEAEPLHGIGNRSSHGDERMLRREGLELKQRRARQESPVHMVERVLGRRPDKDEDALLDSRKQRILPRRVKAMDFVQE